MSRQGVKEASYPIPLRAIDPNRGFESRQKPKTRSLDTLEVKERRKNGAEGGKPHSKNIVTSFTFDPSVEIIL